MKAGLRDEVLTERLAKALAELGEARSRVETLDLGEGRVRLARYLAEVAARLVEDVEDEHGLSDQVLQVNHLIDALVGLGPEARDLHVVSPPSKLTGIYPDAGALAKPHLPAHPVIPLGEAELLSNAAGQPNLGQLVRQECESAIRVDLLCAFIGPTGVHTLLDALEDVVRRGHAEGVADAVRVITSTWLGATKQRALDMLAEIGVRVFVVYDGARLRLHAKSWRFERPGGLTTAYVGSSNLSRTALEQGLEWNVRLSQRTNPAVIERIRHTFEAYLEDAQFEPYDPHSDGPRLQEALSAAASPGRSIGLAARRGVGIPKPRPYAFQARILGELQAARQRHDRHRNLVVAATGTGKTVIAAFDYAALAKQAGGPLPSLLFVAHRKTILDQAQATFRTVLGRPEFGEVLAGGRPEPRGPHVFASIQSLRDSRLEKLKPDAYEVMIVDEFHHACADTYDELLRHLQPRELVGLTATPERADGQDVTRFFDGHITCELRLWEAIDQGLLAPFHYFGVDDETDLRSVRWTRGRYDAGALENVLTGNERRVEVLVTALRRYVPAPEQMRTLGFCVSVDHAHFMAASFNARGIPSACVHGGTGHEQLQRFLRRLEDPSEELRCLFSVEVLGEGVDVPDVDTILLLRPTESATVFLQQLGRGLRKTTTKEMLTVIDMVGIPHERFRFDKALGTMVDPAGGSVRKQAELGFPFLPSGCEIYFEKRAYERVLLNLKSQVGTRRWRKLVEELQAAGPRTKLPEFLDRMEREVEHVYTGKDRSWGRLRQDAGFAEPGPSQTQGPRARLYTLLHVDDEERVSFFGQMLGQDRAPDWAALSLRQRRLLDMLLVGLWNKAKSRPPRSEALIDLWRDDRLRVELMGLFEHLASRSRRITLPLEVGAANPARLHARYTKEEALVAFGKSSYDRPPQLQRGVYRSDEERTDFFFVTLRKDEKTFTPETRYRDFALGPRRFHWETQHATKASDAVAQRYIHHERRRDHIGLFVRETTKTASGAAEPFTFLGRCRYRSHEGSEPVQIIWDLEHDMPAELLEVARLVG